jgi:hypothetical protein
MDSNYLGDVAFIDGDRKDVTVVDMFGEVFAKIAVGFSDPVDLRFDGLGHLYILDRGAKSVLVYRLPLAKGGSMAKVATFTLPAKSPGSFQKAGAFSLDSAGRLSIYDEREKRILLYQ